MEHLQTASFLCCALDRSQKHHCLFFDAGSCRVAISRYNCSLFIVIWAEGNTSLISRKNTTLAGINVTVNATVLNRYLKVLPFLRENIDTSEDLIFCGHRLGGAVAAMAACDFAASGSRTRCITLGAPRTGSKSFTDLFERTTQGSVRICAAADWNTWLPLNLHHICMIKVQIGL